MLACLVDGGRKMSLRTFCVLLPHQACKWSLHGFNDQYYLTKSVASGYCIGPSRGEATFDAVVDV